jgi:hypothetical protein
METVLGVLAVAIAGFVCRRRVLAFKLLRQYSV